MHSSEEIAQRLSRISFNEIEGRLISFGNEGVRCPMTWREVAALPETQRFIKRCGWSMKDFADECKQVVLADLTLSTASLYHAFVIYG